MKMSSDEDDVIAYLLGDLDARAREDFDARFSADPSLAEWAMAIEDDLLFEYARGDLSGETRARIEKAYGETPARRARLDSAFAFFESIPSAPEAHLRPQRAAAWRTRYFMASLLAAAALMLAVWLPTRKHIESPHIESVASFELDAGLARSGAGKEITLPAGARTIEFQLRLRSQPDSIKWRVSLGTVERSVSWSGPAVVRDRLVVTVVPASVLTPGDYTLRLFGGDAAADMPERATYYFRVE